MEKQWKKNDPYASRESKRYTKPIASREHILSYLTETKKPIQHIKLEKVFSIKSDIEKKAFKRRLNAMVRDGQILRNRRGSYALVEELKLVKGRVLCTKDGGKLFYGVLQPVIISAYQMQDIMHGDEVLARLIPTSTKNNFDCIIVDIIKRGIKQLVGRYHHESGLSFVSPIHKHYRHDILIPPGGMAVANSEYVVIDITHYPSKHQQMIGKIIQILGDYNVSGLEIEVALRSYSLPHEWSPATTEELKHIPSQVNKKDIDGREDWRDLPFVTIDGETAKDFDDAVYATRDENGDFCLYVAIADVSHYVQENSSLDTEAKARGTSVYFPSRVIPMLPEKISNELCSLKPEADRLALAVKLHIDNKGKVLKSSFHLSVICSHARLTYNQVAKMLTDEIETPDWFFDSLADLESIYLLLNKQRQQRGAIGFDIPEPKIIYNDQGKIQTISKETRITTHFMIEEFMLLANEAVALFLIQHKLPGLYRVHAQPETDRINNLREFIQPFGLKLEGGSKPHAKDIARLMEKIHKIPEGAIIQMVVLMTMPQAVYHIQNGGHFGLSYQAYAHFTSPIRRYPDLHVHRIIKSFLFPKQSQKTSIDKIELSSLAEHCCITERRAEDANRQVISWLKCHFMLDKVGATYSGYITGVKSFGIFVQLSDLYIEGMVHVTNLMNDYYIYDEIYHKLIGRHTGNTYTLGDKVNIQVARVDLHEHKIDFIITNN